MFGIASTALLAAIAVYCFVRIFPPELLKPFQSNTPMLIARAELFGSAPSLLYTFAIGLIIGSCATTPAGARIHCLSWSVLAMLLEISQHPAIAKPVASWLSGTLLVPAWKAVEPYWNQGVFDTLDLVATAAGGVTALIFLSYLSTGYNDENR